MLEFFDVLNKVTSLIKKTDSYQNLLKAKKTLENNNDIIEKLEEYKHLQKIIVNLELNDEDIKEKEAELENKKTELFLIPLYQIYYSYLEEVNELLYSISCSYTNYLNDLTK